MEGFEQGVALNLLFLLVEIPVDLILPLPELFKTFLPWPPDSQLKKKIIIIIRERERERERKREREREREREHDILF
jgi:hypothetical protein